MVLCVYHDNECRSARGTYGDNWSPNDMNRCSFGSKEASRMA